MTLQFVPPTILYFISAAVAATLAFVTWRMKPERAGTWLAILIFMIIWTIGGIIENSLTDLHQKLTVITAVLYLGVAGVIYFWPIFAIIYSRHEKWLNKYTIILLAIVPVAHYIILNTNQWHHLFWTEIFLIEENGYLFFSGNFGIWFWVWVIYGYTAILCASLLLATSVIRAPRVYQGQALMLILGALFPLIANFLYFIGLNPIAPMDLSPVTFVFSGIFITIALLRFRLFDFTPIAHDLIFNGMTSGVLIIDLKGIVMDLNPAAESILSRDKNELVGQDIYTAFPAYEELLRQYETITNTRVEVTLGPNNPVFEVQIMPLTNRRGKLTGRIVLLYDITERKRTAAERDKLINELDAYASTVAHDLKNPLGLIAGHINLIKRKNQEALPANAQHSLNVIGKTSLQMAQIVDALLLLANVRNVDAIKREPLDTAVIINNAWSNLSDLAQQANAQLIQPDTWPIALGYAPWVEQVWTNYLSNAIKYGGEPPLVEIGADPLPATNGHAPHIRFWVRDNGNGLTPDECEQLFREFSRLDQHSKLQGHGLGLSIVKRILDKLDGTFGVESEPGKGSTFYFTLPMAAETKNSRENSPEQIKSS